MQSQGSSYPDLSGFAADEAMRQLDDSVELAIRRHEQFSEAERRIERMTVTEESPDGVVRVTVRANGALAGLELAEVARTMQPRQLAAVIQRCVQQAQAGVATRTEEILRATAPEDPLTDELAATMHKAFPPPLTAPEAPAAGPRTMPIGDIDDDWGGKSFMVRGTS
jgi:DNA-binding protein YbaB